MFDKTFFKFALGFMAVVALSMGAVYLSGRLTNDTDTNQPASPR